ncbi:uncharacterized protein BO97DRAFT_479745 [Aspergillus homomorphus CBS 101889]|uniref:Erythromycin esterase n=1 Tax=Aspergillus homomorphus (strain CBS 101889) TaxID=1450537 RepID=A0A395HPJ7_ASPHC|nr:hypothetical protein BO97DRAFT_479745 [Aspergillus homomorphus CBS 101889]RAL09882.1 hypothetical protein BO97DRAFT_479745 [Aspergillus homomorphus CBS 101889]
MVVRRSARLRNREASVSEEPQLPAGPAESSHVNKDHVNNRHDDQPSEKPNIRRKTRSRKPTQPTQELNNLPPVAEREETATVTPSEPEPEPEVNNTPVEAKKSAFASEQSQPLPAPATAETSETASKESEPESTRAAAERAERTKKRSISAAFDKAESTFKKMKSAAFSKSGETPKKTAGDASDKTEATPKKTPNGASARVEATPKRVAQLTSPLKGTPSRIPSVSTPLRATPAATKAPGAKTPSTVMARPSHQEMHPSKVHQSTTKQPDSGLVLGFNPIKKDAEGNVVKDATIENTPTKTRDSPASAYYGTPAFDFKFTNQDSQLSDEAKKLMETVRQDAAKIKAQMIQGRANGVSQDQPEQIERKIVQPKGKTDRFTDAHLAEFRKMDSIASHASVLRAVPGRYQPAMKNSLKRTNSKARLDETHSKSPSPSKTSVARPSPAPVLASAKRVKHTPADDVSTSRLPTLNSPKPALPRPKHSFRKSLMTPTRASAARASTVRPARTSMIPSLVRSPAPTQPEVPRTPQTDFNPRLKSNLPTLGHLKSILRQPHQLFSKDPLKIAAGTHVAAPHFGSNMLFGSSWDATEEHSHTPSPKKRVEFTPCVKDRNEETVLSPSPSKLPTANASRVVSDIVYPTLPTLTPEQNRSPSKSGTSPRTSQTTTPTIRQVRPSDATPLPEIAGVPHGIGHKKRNRPTVEEEKTDADSLPEIAGVPHGIGHKKRNRTAVEAEETNAENVPPADNAGADARSAKRMKMSSPSPFKKTGRPSTLFAKASGTPSASKTIFSSAAPTPTPTKPRSHTPLRSATRPSAGRPSPTSTTPGSARPRSRGVLTMSRLHLLSQPKGRS